MDKLEKAAMAAFRVWRQYPPLPEKKILEDWNALDPALKEPWFRTAKAVVEVIEKDDKLFSDDIIESENPLSAKHMYEAFLGQRKLNEG